MITTPYSLELTAHQDAKEAVADIDSTAVAGKMKIFLGSSVTAANRQSYVGTLKAIFRTFMEKEGRAAVSTNRFASADAMSGSASTVTIGADGTAIGAPFAGLRMLCDASINI